MQRVLSNASKSEICDLDNVSQMYVNDLCSDNNKQILKDALDIWKYNKWCNVSKSVKLSLKKCKIVPKKCPFIPIAIIKTFPVIISDYSDRCDLCHCLTSPQCRQKFCNKEEPAPIRKREDLLCKEPTKNRVPLRLRRKITCASAAFLEWVFHWKVYLWRFEQQMNIN